MKYFKIILFVSLVVFVFYSCDKIKEPYIDENYNPGDTTQQIVRKVLLEDYTGHKCTNCPRAEIIAHDLKNYYGDNLIVMCVHAGWFAQPSSSGYYTYDFTTPTGNELDQYFGISAVGNPNGMINRTKVDGSVIINPDNWGTAIDNIIKLPPDVSIKILNNYNHSTRELQTNVKTEFLNNLNGNFDLCVYMIEDSIAAPQKNSNKNIGPTPDILDYVHRHVLRGAINSTWGDNILTGEITNKNYYFTLKDNWDESHCSVLAFIYNEDTKEIIQVEEKEIE